MSAISMERPHKHVARGSADMEAPKKEHKIGNTTVIVYSPLVLMSDDERAEWFNSEWEKGNPVLKEIAAAVEDCYRD
ncbi:hypothetical protein J1P26_22805 [Neobacillus sp. MM2021_6]|uniref:hypothetical protein n=1 Tax=Bacillaceae TaxID=186817 RepID=UPI00140DF587|nr:MULTISPECIES: hypothetical protein [Bacillaceae]MBO0962529.1 hypothetical protein [Neobacillus sp. MM2021_6]NHC20993.1 hypothetical protein [Bacillus sp. MM2020_4]